MRKKCLLLIFVIICFTCNSFSQTILSESFDAATFVPAGWYKAKIYPTNFPASGQWERVTTGVNPIVNPHSGAAMARFDSPNAGWQTISELGTSVLNLSAGGSYRVRFWVYRMDYSPFLGDLLDVYINTQQNITGGNKLGSIFISRSKNPVENANGWYEYMFDIPASFNTNINYIIFRATGASSNTVYVDDVSVETYTCNKPTNITATNVLITTATINWTAPVTGTPTGYEWEVRTSGSAGTGATGLMASGTTAAGITTATATGLSQGVSHYLYVRSSCGADKSTWSNAVIFTTQCNPSSIPYTENFDGISSGIPACTFVENVNGGNFWTSVVNTIGSNFSKSAPNALYCSVGGTGSSGAQNDLFYTAPLNLEAGKCYQLSFAYRNNYYAFTQSLKVNIGTAQNLAAMIGGEIYNNPSITNDSYLTVTNTFTVPSTGVYFLGFNLYGALGNGYMIIDDISITESIGLPTNITANPIGFSTAQLNWGLPTCGLPTSYDWELRTSGAAGSGPTGLFNSGNGAGLTNTFTGLAENKLYTFYVRAKNGSTNSAWSAGVSFRTICDVRPLPYFENFDGVVSPAFPACFIRQDITPPYSPSNSWQNESYDRPYSYPNCMRFGTQNSNLAGDNWLFTPPFNFMAGKSYRLIFYYRGHTYTLPEKLEVKYGNSANASSMISTPIFSNTDLRHTIFKKAVVDFVPAQNGNYSIGFHGISDYLRNFIYVDDIKVEETPECDVVKEISSINITTTTANINWLAPQTGAPTGYEWEVRTSGVAGSGATGLVSSGTLPSGALSAALNNLTAGTNYTFYIRSNCTPLNSVWVPYTFISSCNAVLLPYNENFDGITPPALPTCTKVEENFDEYKWQTASGIARSAPNCLYHSYTFISPFDDWFFTAPLQLTVGKSYRLSFYYSQEAAGYSDALEIKLGNYAQGSAMTLGPIYSNTALNNVPYQLATVTFTVPVSGIYYLGIHSIIAYYSRGVAIDDINVTEINPDLVITNASISSNTAATSETITTNFTVTNQGITNAVPHKTYFYLSPDAALTPGANGDIFIGEYINPTTINAVSNTGNLSKQLLIPCTLAAGNYTLFIMADGENIITEANEINNTVSFPITIYKGAFWNGSVSTAWETAANWSCNVVPDANTDVIINNGTPVINASTTIKSLTVKAGVNLNVVSAVVFTILQ